MCRRTLFLIFLVLVLGGASHTCVGQDPVAHYEFGGVADFSNSVPGATSVATPVGDTQVIWDDDRGSYVLSLDGDGDYINCGNEDIGHIDTAITVAAWIKTDSLGSGDRVVGKSYAWWLGGGANGATRLEISNTAPGSTDGSTQPALRSQRRSQAAG